MVSIKYFVVSDIHGFYYELREALDAVGFNENNPEHHIISCGDLLDRGPQPKECVNFFLHRPNDILIRGNHEDLLVEYLQRGYPYSRDYSNGTVYTVVGLCDGFKQFASNEECLTHAYHYVKPYLDRTIDYYETEHYIFVHGWIPCITEDTPAYYTKGRTYQYNPEWRFAYIGEWNHSRWFNGMDCAHAGVIEPNKTIVCGHWHSSYGHSKFEQKCTEFGEDADFSPYYTPGIVAIDACTVHTRKVNVLVLEDE